MHKYEMHKLKYFHDANSPRNVSVFISLSPEMIRSNPESVLTIQFFKNCKIVEIWFAFNQSNQRFFDLQNCDPDN